MLNTSEMILMSESKYKELLDTQRENIALLHECKRLNEKLDKIETLYKSLIAEIGGISNGR